MTLTFCRSLSPQFLRDAAKKKNTKQELTARHYFDWLDCLGRPAGENLFKTGDKKHWLFTTATIDVQAACHSPEAGQPLFFAALVFVSCLFLLAWPLSLLLPPLLSLFPSAKKGKKRGGCCCFLHPLQRCCRWFSSSLLHLGTGTGEQQRGERKAPLETV